MGKLSAILLISLLAFSQYARQLSYLECKLFNIYKPDTSKCDCDKKAGLTRKDTHQLPVSKTHTHIHLDQFFSSQGQINIDTSVNSFKKDAIRLDNDDECEGNYAKPWQPPNT